MMDSDSQCFSCRRPKDFKDLKRCSRCLGALYCSLECQKKDWSSHKKHCRTATCWYDRHRGCRDGSMHEGKLELITWEYTDPEYGYRMGWGNVLYEEAEYLKHKFEVTCGGDPARFFKEWPQGFRWTCCGLDGSTHFGCDHHGSGRKPCTCDFCRMGKPLPDSIYLEQTGERMGLKLLRGPDPRSYNPALAVLCATGRQICGMDADDS